MQYEALVSTSEQERGGWLNVTSSTEYIKTRQNSPAYNERNLKPGLLGCFHLLHFKDIFLKMIFWTETFALARVSRFAFKGQISRILGAGLCTKSAPLSGTFDKLQAE